MSKDKKEKMAHITNLISMARMDGEIAEVESNCIGNLAARFDLTEQEFRQCMEDSNKVVVEVPESDEDKVIFLRNLAYLMMVDGQVTEDEYKLLAYLVDQFGYEESAIKILVDDIIKEAQSE